MKKLLLLAFLYTPFAFAQPTVCNVQFDNIGHSTVRVTWDLCAGGPVSFHRIRYGTTTMYESGANGGINDQRTQNAGGDTVSATTNIQVDISGMAPASVYDICPQSSSDGSTWSTCPSGPPTVTTLTAPSPDPQLPTLPTTFPLTMPNTTGITVFTVMPDCSDWNTVKQTAEAQRLLTPVALVVNKNCAGTLMTAARAGDSILFAPGTVNIGTNVITVNNTFANNDLLLFGSDQLNGGIPSGLAPYTRWYYACNVSGTTFQVSTGPGCAGIVSLGSTGSTGQVVLDVTQESTNWLLVVPEWPLGSTFTVPPGTQVSCSTDTTNMAKFALNTLGDNQIGLIVQQALHHWRFIGIEFTTTQTSELASTTTDPTPYGFILNQQASVDNIIYDRDCIHSQPFPNRIVRIWEEAEGSNIGVVDSDIEGDYWKANPKLVTDLVPSVNSTTVLRTTAGSYMLGYMTPSFVGNQDFTITGGTPTGVAKLYVDMSGVLTLAVPIGLSVTPCSGCAVITSGTPSFPINGSGNLAAGRLADITIATGTFTLVQDYRIPNTVGTVYNEAEGVTAFLDSCGPGPVMISHTKFDVVGIATHFDDGCNNVASETSNITIQNNLYTIRNSFIPTDGTFDNREREQRNHFECKICQILNITGNTFQNNFAGITPQGNVIDIASSKGTTGSVLGITNAKISDVTIQNNKIWNNAGGIVVAGYGGGAGQTAPTQRVYIYNNLLLTYGWNYYDPALRANTNIIGWGAEIDGANSDIIFDHNTFASLRGSAPVFIYHLSYLLQGSKITNNMFVQNDDGSKLGTVSEQEGTGTLPSCMATGLTAKTMMDCYYTNGSTATSYTFANNVIVPQYANSQALSGQANATNFTSAYAGLPSTVECAGSCSTSTVAQRISNVKFNNYTGDIAGNYYLQPSSPYKNMGTDGLDIGIIPPGNASTGLGIAGPTRIAGPTVVQ